MLRYVLYIILLPLLLFAAGCGITNSADQSDAVQLRVANASDVDFESVLLKFPGVEADYGAVAAGEVTAYRDMNGAYHYGLIEVVTDGDTLRLVPIDYVGEEPLAAGRYTFVLDVEGDALGMTFVED